MFEVLTKRKCHHGIQGHVIDIIIRNPRSPVRVSALQAPQLNHHHGMLMNHRSRDVVKKRRGHEILDQTPLRFPCRVGLQMDVVIRRQSFDQIAQ
jgi:hypothetical protein